MPIYSSELTFREPSADEVPLNTALASVIREHHKRSREHLFHLCMIAYGLRRHNLIAKKGGAGGNAKGKQYKPAFKSWYASQAMEDVYGSLNNFTLYAMAGRLLSYVRWRVGAEY
jgi:hypothetical protein